MRRPSLKVLAFGLSALTSCGSPSPETNALNQLISRLYGKPDYVVGASSSFTYNGFTLYYKITKYELTNDGDKRTECWSLAYWHIEDGKPTTPASSPDNCREKTILASKYTKDPLDEKPMDPGQPNVTPAPEVRVIQP